ncbi:PAS domain S-box protein [Seonamhaeicola algicola]|uniref:histidine kinase n=1 Tax=Seonamhaeicola algicola TaxID=1719036 RepID=A0A5C7AGS8_9FLAO|nr:HAMP domain-containing sensor histidine kinase [Seonamhaeicola algicola]TXE07204.1 PAS domain S-box protein [Seonamhaeicola algicola]
MRKNISLDADRIFENIFNYASGGIAIVSLKGDWIKVNNSIEKTLGYTKEELYNLTFQEITHKDDLDLDVSLMQSLLRGEIESYQIEKRYFHKRGHIIWALLSVSLVRDDYHRPLHFISQVSDISQQKKASVGLQNMLDVAKEQNTRLSNFANIITHNLRTHASNLKTLYSFIEDEENGLIAKSENFSFLKESILNLNETVTHLAEIAKIRAVSDDKMERVNLRLYVKNAIYNVSALVKNINFTIENNVKPDHYLRVIPAYLDSIILNFLTNAIKYRSTNRPGKVVLSSFLEDDYVVLCVRDNGIGIDLDKHGNHMFEMYKTFHRNKDAMGLGLFITRNQIESMGGYVEVESEVGIGTKFLTYLKKSA